MKLFIYGTLKHGQIRAGAMNGQRFLGNAMTTPKYRMFDCGEYPALVETDDGKSIEGELWEVDSACLDVLDELEGTNIDLFQRGTVELQRPHDNDQAVAYFYQGNTAQLPNGGTCWQ